MRINKALLDNGISVSLLSQLIEKHKRNTPRYTQLYNYYLGKHSILERKRDSPDLPNNKAVSNFAKYITDMSSAYLLGCPVTYTSNININPVIDCYYEQTIAQKDSEIVSDMSIFGRAYELVYANSKAEARTEIIRPQHIFVVYDDTVENNKLFAVHYYPQFDLQGNHKGYKVFVYTDKSIIEYEGDSGAYQLRRIQEREHYFGGVPVIEYLNNKEKQGDFEQEISLIDAYNTLQSDRINDKEQFVDAFLLLSAIEIDSEQAIELRREKILIDINGDGKAEYLSKVLAESDVEVLKNSIKEDIHKFSLVPDLSDEKFSGNASGVAIRYKLLAFEQHTKNKERFFEQGLKERFYLYNHFLNIKHNMPIVSPTEIDCVFSRNLPVNEYELAQMVVALKNTVSEETLLGQIPFVTDPKEELEIVKNEKKESLKQFEGLGGYNEETEQ